MPKRARETEAPPINEDGPHVVLYDPQYSMVSDTFYKFKDPNKEGDVLRLPCGNPIVKQCRAHNGGRKLYCVHRKENSKCCWCKQIGQGGGTSYCPHKFRRELCPHGCRGTNRGILKSNMRRSSCCIGGGVAATGSKFRRAGESRKTRKLKAREVGDDDRVHESFDARQEADSDDEDEEEWDSDGQSVADEWEEVHAAGSDTDYDDMMDIGSTQEKDDVMGKLSEYEKRRLENIARNDAAIALLSEKFPLASLPKKEKKRRAPQSPRKKTRFMERRSVVRPDTYRDASDSSGDESDSN